MPRFFSILALTGLAFPSLAAAENPCAAHIEESLTNPRNRVALPISTDMTDRDFTFIDKHGFTYTLRRDDTAKDLNLDNVSALNDVSDVQLILGGDLPLVFLDMRNLVGNGAIRQCFVGTLKAEGELIPHGTSS